jgi:hypothetical protein
MKVMKKSWRTELSEFALGWFKETVPPPPPSTFAVERWKGISLATSIIAL